MLLDCRRGVSVAEPGDACRASASWSQPAPSMVEDFVFLRSISGCVVDLADVSNTNLGSALAVHVPTVHDQTSILDVQPMDVAMFSRWTWRQMTTIMTLA